MNNLLMRKGHHVVTADGALAALAILETYTPDIIFIDLVMPYISGDKLSRIIRTIPQFNRTPIIILSAVAAEEKVDFVSCGANACIAKGLFNKMGENVLSVLDQLEHGSEQLLSETIIGSEDVYQREISKELLSSKKHFEAILDNLSEGIIELTPDAQILYANPAAMMLLHKPEEKLLASRFVDCFTGSHRERIENLLENAWDRPQKITDDAPIILNERQITLSCVAVVEHEQQCLIVIMHDISERKRMEAHLQQAQKMKAIATLAGGIAHEFNNALCGITGNVELMQMDLPQDEKIVRYADAIRIATERIAHLTSQLLAYGQGGKYYPRVISLSDFAEDTLSIVRHNLENDALVETDLAKNLRPVKVDLTQMQMVLTTLLNNASEGIGGEGHIRVSTSNVHIDEHFVAIHPDARQGSFVCLTVEDDGVGMDEETRSKIFEPFFSTKFHGRGLAMAAVYGVVRNHGGFILVDSQLGKGTIVRIYLPAVNGNLQPQQ